MLFSLKILLGLFVIHHNIITRYKWYIPFTFKRGSNLAKEAELVWLTPDEPGGNMNIMSIISYSRP